MIDDAFRKACQAHGVRHVEAFQKSLKNVFIWKCLDGKLPHGITPTDIDASMEFRRQFVVFETKHWEAMKDKNWDRLTGQDIAFRELAKTRRFTVIYVGHENYTEPRLFKILYPGGQVGKLQETDTGGFVKQVQGWCDFIEKRRKQ